MSFSLSRLDASAEAPSAAAALPASATMLLR